MNTVSELKNAFLEAIESLSKEYKGSSLTDIFVLVDEDTGELSVYDDENNCLVRKIIDEWACDHDEVVNYVEVLKTVMKQMHDENLFSALDLYTPFSINLADEDFLVQEELLLIEDDSIIRLESDFMKRMDKEFDEFLDKLLKD